MKVVLGATSYFLVPQTWERSGFIIPRVATTSDGAGALARPLRCELSPVPSRDYPAYKTPPKQHKNGPITYFWDNYRPSKAVP